MTAILPTYLLYLRVTYLCLLPLMAGTASILFGIQALRSRATLGSHVGWIALTLSILSVLVSYLVIRQHDRSGQPIVLVIPDGYRGPITLIVAPSGAEVRARDGQYTFQIPESGTLYIRDDSRLQGGIR
ncbi:MAG: hypothetical protein AB7K24_13380 [Gemmataceae bacterium]